MPALAPRACPSPGCRAYVPCTTHGRKAERLALDERRGTAHERGYGARWRRARAAYLAAHPLCVHAQRHGRVEPATVLDHVKPHRGAMSLFWLPENWQPLSERAHGLKTIRENGLAKCEEHGAAIVEICGETICRDCGRAVR